MNELAHAPRQDSDATLERELAQQISNARQRMERGGYVYPDEYEEATEAATHVWRLREELGLGAFKRTLIPSGGKPRFLLVFATPLGAEVVLKVYGRRRPGEISLERLWNHAGIPAVEIIDGGNEPATWLLMTPIPATPVAEHPLRGTTLLEVTGELSSLMRDAHQIPLPADEADLLTSHGYRLFGPAIKRHLAAVTTTLTAHGYAVRDDWPEIADALEVHRRSALLHGDLSVGNVIRHAHDGGLRLLDAAAYLGPPEFDAARWAARTGGAKEGQATLTAWLEVESGLDVAYAHQLLGLELLMEAGVRELVKDEDAEELGFPDQYTLELLSTADNLLPSN